MQPRAHLCDYNSLFSFDLNPDADTISDFPITPLDPENRRRRLGLLLREEGLLRRGGLLILHLFSMGFLRGKVDRFILFMRELRTTANVG